MRSYMPTSSALEFPFFGLECQNWRSFLPVVQHPIGTTGLQCPGDKTQIKSNAKVGFSTLPSGINYEITVRFGTPSMDMFTLQKRVSFNVHQSVALGCIKSISETTAKIASLVHFGKGLPLIGSPV